MKHIFTTITITALTLLAVLSGCKKNEPVNSTVKDICGNSYKYVKIGEQYWMAENMRCNKYDTESGRAGATLSTSSSFYGPYYKDASDWSKWETTEYSLNLTDEQVSRLGYLYSWAAAVGLETAEQAMSQTSGFNGNRQGICPNGWHVPTTAEWDVLGVALGGVEDKYGFYIVGRKLKATSGWYISGKYGNFNGTDDYSFAALPAGYKPHEGIILDVGLYANFWTATPDKEDYECADGRYMNYSSDYLAHDFYFFKDYALSVRCVKD